MLRGSKTYEYEEVLVRHDGNEGITGASTGKTFIIAFHANMLIYNCLKKFTGVSVHPSTVSR